MTAYMLAAKLRRILRGVAALPPVLGMSGVLDKAAARRAARPSSRYDIEAKYDHVVLPTVGMGNVGDQALLESYLAATAGSVAVIVESYDAFRLPHVHRGRVKQVRISGLVSGFLATRRGSRRAFIEAVSGAKTFTVIGADIMDGGYDRREAVLRCHLLSLAHRLSVESRLVSFSWKKQSDRYAAKALRRISEDVALFPRDSLSLARLTQSNIRRATLSSDIVFSHSEIEVDPEIAEWLDRQGSSRIVVLNVSGLIGVQEGKCAEYRRVVDWLLGQGVAVILLPHVIRKGDDDQAAVDAVAAGYSSPRILVVRRLLNPGQIAWVAGRADAILTGRMHLAVLGLKGGTPAAIFGTQDKVEGLLKFFKLDEFALDAESNLSSSATRALARLLNEPSLVAQISAALPRVRELSLLPLLGLDSPRTPG